MTISPSEFISTRSVGDATVSVISEGTIRWAPRFAKPEAEWRRAVPEADAEGLITLGLNLMHVRLDGASIVIDPGMDEPDSALQREMQTKWLGMTRTPGLDEAMTMLGHRPDDVTHVLITHTHDDHFAGVVRERNGSTALRFPHAKHLVGRADWDGHPKRLDPSSAMSARLGAVERAGLLDLVTDTREIVPGLTMIPAAGESPGHCVVRVRSGDGRVYYLGDLVHHGCEVEHPDWAPGQNRDTATLLESRRRVFDDIDAAPALVVFSHARFPAWGRLRSSGSGRRFEMAG
jgi:glyoxylase-like metal-dependent hydrolase (beta-lactamase superfamily II)